MSNNYLIGIDPSYTSTGLAVLSDDLELVDYDRIQSNIKIYDKFTSHHKASEAIIDGIYPYFLKYPDSSVIIEYPALHTISGASLAILNGYLAAYLNRNGIIKSVTYINPTAINSYTKNKARNKTHIVNWCKEHNLYNKQKGKSLNQDVCSAIVLACILKEIQQGIYKKSYYTYER